MAQPGHDGVVLAKIAGMFEIGQRHRGAGRQRPADIAAIIRAAIIDQHNLDPTGGLEGR